jgi:hypothetical protein
VKANGRDRAEVRVISQNFTEGPRNTKISTIIRTRDPTEIRSRRSQIKRVAASASVLSVCVCVYIYYYVFDQRVARQQLCIHCPTRNDRLGCVFYVVRAEQRWNSGVINPFQSNGKVNTFPRKRRRHRK